MEQEQVGIVRTMRPRFLTEIGGFGNPILLTIKNDQVMPRLSIGWIALQNFAQDRFGRGRLLVFLQQHVAQDFLGFQETGIA